MHELFSYAYNNPENIKKVNIHNRIMVKLAKLIFGILEVPHLAKKIILYLSLIMVYLMIITK
jgi:hypothetical protein